jgi:hypothetical protein
VYKDLDLDNRLNCIWGSLNAIPELVENLPSEAHLERLDERAASMSQNLESI